MLVSAPSPEVPDGYSGQLSKRTLSPSRARLVELMKSINYGRLRDW